MSPNSETFDGNGNVIAYIDMATGAKSATYDYNAFGETIISDGVAAELFPFKFSTKYYHAEVGIYDFGRRDYQPPTGRFLSRDPIEEEGGVNLYAFVCNAPTDKYDMLGMWGTSGHTIIANRWLKNYSNYKWIEGSAVDVIGLVDTGSQKVDGDTGSASDFLNAQSQANAYQHAMRSPLQSVSSAKTEMERFVREKVNAARNLAIVARKECDVEKLRKAVTIFGEGMHPVMDSTSPSHAGFQVWFGPSWALLNPGVYAAFVTNHHIQETDAVLYRIMGSVVATMRAHNEDIEDILKKSN